MIKPTAFIFSGLVIILLGIGSDFNKLFPNEFLYLVGDMVLSYGILLYFTNSRTQTKMKANNRFTLKDLSPAFIVICGILIAKSNRIIEYPAESELLSFGVSAAGLIIAFYGAYLVIQDRINKRHF
jgi:hypothetical protein